MSSPTRKRDADLSAEEFRKKYPVQFGPDEEVAKSLIYRVFFWFFYTLTVYIYGFEIKGLEHFKGLRNWFTVGMHTTHNADILTGLFATYAATGHVPRGLLHRSIYFFNPWLAYIGMLPGYRNAAVDLLKSGFVCGVLPGGGEEAMTGHENAYKLHPRWKDRRGFVKVARAAGGVPIIPWFCQNIEEMRFNPIFWFANKIGLTRFYDLLMALPGPIGWIFKQIGLYTWFGLSWIAIPIPVKLTVHIGAPVPIDWEKETDDDLIAERVRLTLQKLIDEHQPHGHSYWPGLRDRFWYLLESQLPKEIGGPILALFGRVEQKKQKNE